MGGRFQSKWGRGKIEILERRRVSDLGKYDMTTGSIKFVVVNKNKRDSDQW